MGVYALAGTALDVDLPIPELDELAPTPPAAGRPGPPLPDRSWSVRRAGRPTFGDLATIAELRTTSGVLWGRIEAGPGAYRLTYPDLVVFEVDVAERRVSYVPGADAADLTVRHLLIDQVLPYLLVADGTLVLHASCVARGGVALGFIGPTGAGKSSMAAGFVQRGWTLLADDLAVVEERGGGYAVTPVYPGLRLWADSAQQFTGAADDLPRVADYTDKRRWAVPTERGLAPGGAVSLVGLVALGSRPEPGQPDCRIGRLGGADAFAVVCEEAFRLERSGREHQAADLERFARFVERVPVHLIEYRRDYPLLPDVQAAILDAVVDR